MHLWDKGRLVDGYYPKGSEKEFTCKVCAKKKRYWNYTPISGILPPDPWEAYKKDPYNNMSPPMFRDDD